MNSRRLPKLKLTRSGLEEWKKLVGNSFEVLSTQDAEKGATYLECSSLSTVCQDLAMIDYYLLEPAPHVRNLLAKSAYYKLKYLNLIIEQNKQSVILYAGANAIHCALIGQRMDLAKGLAEALKIVVDKNLFGVANQYGNNYCRMLIHLLLDQEQNAIEFANKILASHLKDLRTFFEPLAKAGISFIEQDSVKLRDALTEFLPVYEKMARHGVYRDVSDGMMSFAAMAFLAFASTRDINVVIEHLYIFPDLLS